MKSQDIYGITILVCCGIIFGFSMGWKVFAPPAAGANILIGVAAMIAIVAAAGLWMKSK